MKTTATLGLKKPDGNDVVNIDDFNFNADKIDLEFGKVNEKFKNIDTSADKISIKDANNNFTSTTVEGALNELFQNVDNGKSSIATAIVGKGVQASKEDSFPTLANKISSIKLASGNAQPSDVLSGKTFTNTNGNQTGTMPNRGGATTVNPGTSNQVKPSGYYSGDITIKGDANLKANNIVEGATIFGIKGIVAIGKKIAEGIYLADNSTITIPSSIDRDIATIQTNLSFTPSRIILFIGNALRHTSQTGHAYPCGGWSIDSKYNNSAANGACNAASYSGNSANYYISGITSSNFKLSVKSGYSGTSLVGPIRWLAIE